MKEKVTSPQETLEEIKHLMERSSRFISLSGLSGVFAGLYALIGAFFAYKYLNLSGFGYLAGTAFLNTRKAGIYPVLFADATIVLVLAIGTGIFLTTRKAKKDGNSLLDNTARKLIINLAIPLTTGGLFCLILTYQSELIYVAPSMLVFYGLALVHASGYTRHDIRYLGFAEIILGLMSLAAPGFGLLFWSLGFGVLHIAYGAYMYFKYEV